MMDFGFDSNRDGNDAIDSGLYILTIVDGKRCGPAVPLYTTTKT